MKSERSPKSREVTIRGKAIVFSSITRKGKTTYYRNGEKITSNYGMRLARGVLAGQSPREAVGRKPSSQQLLREKRLTNADIAAQDDFFEGYGRDTQNESWAASPQKKDPEKHQYYIKVSVTSDSFRRIGSEPKDEESCTPATLLLLDPSKNTQTGFTYAEVNSRLKELVIFTVERNQLELCSGNLDKDLLGVWHHASR